MPLEGSATRSKNLLAEHDATDEAVAAERDISLIAPLVGSRTLQAGCTCSLNGCERANKTEALRCRIFRSPCCRRARASWRGGRVRPANREIDTIGKRNRMLGQWSPPSYDVAKSSGSSPTSYGSHLPHSPGNRVISSWAMGESSFSGSQKEIRTILIEDDESRARSAMRLLLVVEDDLQHEAGGHRLCDRSTVIDASIM